MNEKMECSTQFEQYCIQSKQKKLKCMKYNCINRITQVVTDHFYMLFY